MRQVIFLRHAQAQAARPGLADFDRALTALGRTEALDAAERLKDAGVRLDALIASPAVRARETAQIVAARLDFDEALRYEPTLYLGAPEALLTPLQRCEAQEHTVLMVGHNPALSALVQRLRRPEHEPLELHTAGMCRVAFEVESWSALAPEGVSEVSILR